MIYINGRFLLQEQTGVNRFAYELCKALHQSGIFFILLCPHGEIKMCYDTAGFSIKHCGWGKSHIWEQLFLPIFFLKTRGKHLLVNFTGIGPIALKNKIRTIHDLGFMVNSKWYSLSYILLYKTLTPLSAATSLKILTVSEFSKNEIMRLLNVKKDKISVIYNAVSSLFMEPDTNYQYSEKKEKYILAVSSIDPRKNFATLLKAFSMLKDTDIKLYIAGGQNRIYSISVEELSANISSEKIKWLGRVSDAELKRYYEGASCFVYPSLYEGFGIPPLEAMACGVPVVVSDIPPIREVCGDTALYVDPLNQKDIAEKIALIINDRELQEELRTKGRARCQAFGWTQSARTLSAVIAELQDRFCMH